MRTKQDMFDYFSRKYRLDLKNAIFRMVLFSLFFSIISVTPIGEFFDSYFSRKIEFTFRAILKKAPAISDKIKIYAYDDRTMDYLQTAELSAQHWIALLNNMADEKPKAIVIDKIFSTFNEKELSSELFVKEFQKIKSKVPIYVGAFASNEDYSNREKIPFNKVEYSLKEMLRLNSSDANIAFEEPNWLGFSNLFVYGPSPSIRDAFTSYGHLNYSGNGLYQPFIKLQPGFAIPVLPFFIADSIKISAEGPIVNNLRVPLDEKNRIIVNLVDADSFRTSKRTITLRLKKLLADYKGSINPVKKDDIIVILPQMFTGNVDIKDSPIGRIPGSYLLVSLINSVVTGDWLKPFNHEILLIWIGSFIGFVSGLTFWTWGVSLSVFVLPLLFAFIGIFSFSYGNVVVPWLLPGISLLSTALSIFVKRLRIAEKTSIRLEEALEKTVAPERLKQILANPDSLQLEASEQVVTIMFIDIVGFSLAAEKQSPMETFSGLKELVSTIRATIYEFGGVVDKTLGDGVLCFFGYNYEKQKNIESNPAYKNHAKMGLECAIKIQRENLKSCLQNYEQNKPVYPLRIGLNTASVYVGDMGDTRSIEFTLIGHGVNYAKRLEEGSELFRIMLGPTTRDLLSASGFSAHDFSPRNLKIKHHSEVIEAYEFDPFTSDQETFAKALNAYKAFAGFERREPRWTIPNERQVFVKSVNLEGTMLDFSVSGLSVLLPRYYARGVELPLSFENVSGHLKQKLEIEHLVPVIGEVRWGKVKDQMYVHGLMIKNLTSEQKDRLFSILREEIKAETTPTTKVIQFPRV